ncbi:hypothetical protein RsTz2092_02660 [Deferribacterales bacterium RsTz2092]|nr:hypothetical protein AGMMS49941_06870 [Deferribacterales bacterium]
MKLSEIIYLYDAGSHKVLNLFGVSVDIKNKLLMSGLVRLCEWYKTHRRRKRRDWSLMNIAVADDPVFDDWRTSFASIAKSDAYDMLVAGMDSGSVDTVDRVLRGVRLAIDDPACELVLDIYPDEEKEWRRQMQQMKEGVSNMNDYFVCGRYKFPSVPELSYHDGKPQDTLMRLAEIRTKNILDVGAFIGDSAVVLAQYTDKQLYAFEPTSGNYSQLLKTIQLNGTKNIVPVKLALGDSEGEAAMSVNLGMSSLVMSYKNRGSEQIKCDTLDNFAKREGLGEVGLIKIDIEGFEQNFLAGARGLICRDKPVLFISIYHNPSDFFHIKPMLESWGLGYKFRIVQIPHESFYVEILLIAE